MCIRVHTCNVMRTRVYTCMHAQICSIVNTCNYKQVERTSILEIKRARDIAPTIDRSRFKMVCLFAMPTSMYTSSLSLYIAASSSPVAYHSISRWPTIDRGLKWFVCLRCLQLYKKASSSPAAYHATFVFRAPGRDTWPWIHPAESDRSRRTSGARGIGQRREGGAIMAFKHTRVREISRTPSRQP